MVEKSANTTNASGSNSPTAEAAAAAGGTPGSFTNIRPSKVDTSNTAETTLDTQMAVGEL